MNGAMLIDGGGASEIRYAGRTVVVEVDFPVEAGYNLTVVGQRVNDHAQGSKKRMSLAFKLPDKVGTSHRFRVYVNTDETIKEVERRLLSMAPQPSAVIGVEANLVESTDMWKQVISIAQKGRNSP